MMKENSSNSYNKFNKKDYYCDGICEMCEMGKHYGSLERGFDTCDENKIKGLNIFPLVPPHFNHQR